MFKKELEKMKHELKAKDSKINQLEKRVDTVEE